MAGYFRRAVLACPRIHNGSRRRQPPSHAWWALFEALSPQRPGRAVQGCHLAKLLAGADPRGIYDQRADRIGRLERPRGLQTKCAKSSSESALRAVVVRLGSSLATQPERQHDTVLEIDPDSIPASALAQLLGARGCRLIRQRLDRPPWPQDSRRAGWPDHDARRRPAGRPRLPARGRHPPRPGRAPAEGLAPLRAHLPTCRPRPARQPQAPHHRRAAHRRRAHHGGRRRHRAPIARSPLRAPGHHPRR